MSRPLRRRWDTLDLSDPSAVLEFVEERAMNSLDAGSVVSDDVAADWIAEAYQRGVASRQNEVDSEKRAYQRSEQENVYLRSEVDRLRSDPRGMTERRVFYPGTNPELLRQIDGSGRE